MQRDRRDSGKLVRLLELDAKEYEIEMFGQSPPGSECVGFPRSPSMSKLSGLEEFGEIETGEAKVIRRSGSPGLPSPRVQHKVDRSRRFGSLENINEK